MIYSTAMLLDEYREYQDPFGKIRRECKDGKLFQLTKGLYESDGNLSGHLLASAIYGPSYLSFDYALSYYGLIPEMAREYTSATNSKGKKKYYRNAFGNYSYRDVPATVFPFEIKLLTESGYTYAIATPEKALCDKLYTITPIHNYSELESLLFDDLRIYEDESSHLNKDTIAELAEFYHCTNVHLLSRYLRRQS